MTIDVEKPTFIEDQTLDEIPDDFEKANSDLVEDPEKFIEEADNKFEGKASFLTRIITQNIYSDRIEDSGDGQHPDFKSIITAKCTVLRFGNIPTDIEKYNEIARRQTKLHPAVDTKTDFF